MLLVKILVVELVVRMFLGADILKRLPSPSPSLSGLPFLQSKQVMPEGTLHERHDQGQSSIHDEALDLKPDMIKVNHCSTAVLSTSKPPLCSQSMHLRTCSGSLTYSSLPAFPGAFGP